MGKMGKMGKKLEKQSESFATLDHIFVGMANEGNVAKAIGSLSLTALSAILPDNFELECVMGEKVKLRASNEEDIFVFLLENGDNISVSTAISYFIESYKG